MESKKKVILNKIDKLILKRKSELLYELPVIHEIDDGIVIRFFTDWDNCDDNNEIRFRRISNTDNPNEIVLLFYIPKGVYFELKRREYISTITCLNGCVKLDFESRIRTLESYSKLCVDSNVFQGKAMENTYLLTTNVI